MFGTVLSQVTGQLDKRFLLNAFFPTLVFAALMTLVVVSGTGGVDAAVKAWEGYQGALQLVIVIGAVAVVLVIANVLAASTIAIVELFEGYAPLVRPFASMGRRYHYKRWQEAWQREQDARQREPEARSEVGVRVGSSVRERYPLPPKVDGASEMTPDHFAATRLGNVLRNAETYPRQRYGIDPVRTWPLLYPLLDDPLRGALDEARTSMEFLLVIAFWAGLFAPAGAVCLMVFDASTIWVLATLLGSAAISALAYAGALAPASIYNGHVRAAFDMHRLEILEAMRLSAPATLGEEKLIWPRVLPFLDEGTEHTWRYVKAK